MLSAPSNQWCNNGHDSVLLSYNLSSAQCLKKKPLISPISQRLRTGRGDLSSLPWIEFFERELFLEEEHEGLHTIHHVYISSPTEGGPLFVTHHGAGSSGLSFAACAQEIRKILPTAGVLSIDARNHGCTTSRRSPQGGQNDALESKSIAGLDLSLETLSRDLVYMVNQTKVEMGWDTVPPLVLVGHSLGGAVVTDVAKKGELGSNVLAYAVLDVVEGRLYSEYLVGIGKTNH